ncbi:MAG: efflux RND transporter periplasmic adaptor subunit [Gemmatimonas sp.]
MALTISAAATACKKDAPPPRSTPVVAVAKANRGPLPYILNAPGQVEPARTVAVQSQVSGMLTRVAFNEGDEVTQGQVLFEVDSRPFKSELARVSSNLSRDSIQLVQAKGILSRYAQLAKDGAATREQIDQFTANASALDATVSADRAAVDAAKLAVEQSVIRAPISGRTGLLSIRAGNLVRASSEPALVTINEVHPVMVVFAIPEREFGEMRKRAGVSKALDAMIRPSTVSDSTAPIMGKLAFVDNEIDQSTGAVKLKARVPNIDGALWPGQSVRLGLQLSVDSSAITVPTQAVVTSQSGTFIFVVDDQNKAKRAPVKVGRTSGQFTVIDSGLVGDETVITDGQNRLNDGAKVEIRTVNGGRGGRGGDANKSRSVQGDSSGRGAGRDSSQARARGNSGADSTSSGGAQLGTEGSGRGNGQGRGRGRGGN